MSNLFNKIKNRLKNFNQQGLSLIEMVVAIFILTLAFIALSQAFPTGLAINKRASNTTIASYLAQEKIEELHSLKYINIATGTIETKHRLATSSVNYLYYFQRETEVSCVDGNLDATTTDSGLKKLSATIYYTDSVSKTEREYNITTLISKR